VVTPDGEEIAHGQAPIVWTPVPTGAEIAPEGFVECALARRGWRWPRVEDARVVGVGVSGMAETGILLGRDGEPVVPSIAWYDSRGEEEARRIDEEIPGFRATTGLSSRALRTVTKYRWLRDHMPEAERGVRWLSVGEFVVHRLGGEQAPSCRSPRAPAGSICTRALVGRDRRVVGRAARAAARARPSPARRSGHAGDALPQARGAVLAVGGHDHLSAAVGAGAVGEGDVLDSWGTAEALVRAVAPLDREAVEQAVGRRHHGRLARRPRAPEPARRDALRRGARPRHGAARRRARRGATRWSARRSRSSPRGSS
jgi:glycerol kinase